MANTESDMGRGIVIVGAGEAGVAAAATLRSEGFSGPVTLLSAEAVLPYERPPLSKAMLSDPSPVPTLIRPKEWYQENAIDIRLGAEATKIDAGSHRVHFIEAEVEQVIDYSKLLLATGAEARRLTDNPSIHYLRSYSDWFQLRSRLDSVETAAVIGGGVIGLELASTLRSLGRAVRVFEVDAALMTRSLSPCTSEWLAELHRSAGVTVDLDVQDLQVGPDGISIGGMPIEADLIVAGIGAIPNTGLGEAAGCRVANGIEVNDAGQTALPDVYAAGDVASFFDSGECRNVRIETWQNAQRHGAHVARAMMGVEAAYNRLPWFWTDQHGANIQMSGTAAAADTSVWRSSGDGEQHTILHFATGKLIAATTINNGRDMRPATKLIENEWCGDPDLLLDTSVPFAALARKALEAHQESAA